jgi:hypothetical protein
VKYDFTFTLSEQSLKELTKNLKNYQKDLLDSKKYILQALGKYTQERVKYYISNTVGKNRLSQH